MHKFISTLVLIAYVNDLDAFVPEVWAQESLMILENNMVAANLVHRDFENEIAQFGDVVNTRKPAKFTMQRKNVNDSVTVQDATASNVAVKLDQHLHTSFLIRDGEESKGMTSMVQTYLRPALLSLAEGIDQIVLGQVYKFMANSVGKAGTAVSKTTVIDAREKLTQLLCPMGGRNLIITPNMEGTLLGIGDFTTAEKIGDDGSVMREGSMGRRFGFDIFTCQQAPSVVNAAATAAGAVNNGAGYAAGTKTLTVDGFAAAITNGSWVTIDGQPDLVVSTVGGATPTSITTLYGLRQPVVDNAVIVVVRPAQVNNAGGYANGWEKKIIYDTQTPIKPGQLVSYGVAGRVHSALAATSGTEVLLDRPTEATLADNDVLGLGPSGEFGFAFHRNALGLITRPLAMPRAGSGALSAIAAYNGLGLRVVITYDGNQQGHLVTIDMLAGVKEYDTSLGVPFLG
jgi:hypothetical protein